SQKSVAQGLWRNGDIAEAMATFEEAKDQTAGTHAFLDVANALHALSQVAATRIRSDDDDIGLPLDRPLGERLRKLDSGSMRLDGVPGKESADFERFVHDGVDDENLFSQHFCPFLQVEPHRALRDADVIVFLSGYSF